MITLGIYSFVVTIAAIYYAVRYNTEKNRADRNHDTATAYFQRFLRATSATKLSNDISKRRQHVKDA